MRILMIHGRAQGGKSEEELKNIWLETLDKGLSKSGFSLPENISIDLPFYGDRLDEIAADVNLPSTTNVVSKGPGGNPDFEQFMQQALGEISQNSLVSNEIEREVDNANITEKGIANWAVTQAIVRVLDRYLTGVSDFTIEMFLRDVFLYVNYPNVTKEINDIIGAKITNEPTLIVAHSLGSVVAYKVIIEQQQNLNLKGLVTVGCPLGITAISSKLGRVKNPSGSGGWFNAYDERDIVALNPLDSRYFPVSPSVKNDNTIINRTSNRHGITGYLDDTGVAQEIINRLTL